ncbi:hypothetical protein C8J57DRAFT_1706320 [Mycena rebaudengoi]|nr:hypothetical protein C8J57DRAFT_1706320 [Mycena rebaudengoi]
MAQVAVLVRMPAMDAETPPDEDDALYAPRRTCTSASRARLWWARGCCGRGRCGGCQVGVVSSSVSTLIRPWPDFPLHPHRLVVSATPSPFASARTRIHASSSTQSPRSMILRCGRRLSSVLPSLAGSSSLRDERSSPPTFLRESSGGRRSPRFMLPR